MLKQRHDNIQMALLLHRRVESSDSCMVRVRRVRVAGKVATVSALILIVLDRAGGLRSAAAGALDDGAAVRRGDCVIDVSPVAEQHADHITRATVGGDGERGEDCGCEMHIASLLANLLDCVQVVQPDGVQQKVSLREGNRAD